MASENSPPASPGRRASMAPGAKLSEFFGRSPTGSNSLPNNYQGPIAAAAANAQQQRRRMSISTLGLSGSSPNPTSPFSATMRNPRESLSSSLSSSPGADDSAIDESGDAGPMPSSPFSRRLSFGARAMRDASRGGMASAHGRTSFSANSLKPGDSVASPRAAAAAEGGEDDGVGSLSSPSANMKSVANSMSRRAGEGFSWSDQLHRRAERSASISGPASGMPATSGFFGMSNPKRQSVAAEQPTREIPKATKAPDHFQERILKGDFYMD